MVEVDIEQLRQALISIYETYLRDPDNQEMKTQAKELHAKYLNLTQMLDQTMQHAINLLVDIGWDLPTPPKPSKETVQKLLAELKK